MSLLTLDTLHMQNSNPSSCSVKFDFFLMSCMWQDKFVNELTVVVSRKQKVKMLINEGWHTEEEMRTELHWSKLLAYIFRTYSYYNLLYICHFRWPYTPTSKFNSPTPKARIDGAKSRCKSLGPSHYRPGVLSPWFGMIWCVTLKLLWDPWVASMKTDMLLDLIKYSMQ